MAPDFGKIVNHFIFEQSFFSSMNKLTLIFCIEQSVVEKRTLAFRPFAVMAFSGSLDNNNNDCDGILKQPGEHIRQLSGISCYPISHTFSKTSIKKSKI